LRCRDALAEFERSLISERTRAGLSAARRRGSALGRPKKLDRAQLDHVRSLLETRDASKKEIAGIFRVSVSTLYRALLCDQLGADPVRPLHARARMGPDRLAGDGAGGVV
jgi:DNA invertase Pin-like site-specific DNA recombinase